ncbi:hypothetical protein ONS95_014457 [Cadophora gregata]|uniref:uncharacterized protein n=1 Tax=Cadophora gregata TaxID=51156 RepID=UPI0026DD8465|nr:uncharacterized protein ONS95_014457 [Cadophora gregata]KAK0112721.1 hypothetical protein ONS95_014457 [Cadophora gregata]KAK0124854.1 hypothetical protein ONS96_008733 [Cadophora gregata f. sp. sojae]
MLIEGRIHLPLRRPRHAPLVSRKSIIYLCTIILLSTVLGVQTLYMGQKLPTSPTGREFGGCGDSVASARALGCRFEPMSWQWVPEACYYAELIESFKETTEWRFYGDYKLESKDELDCAEILAGDHEVVYTSDKYHLVHCAYQWIKVHQAWVNQKPIDNTAIALGHSKHCLMNVLNPYTGKLGAGNCTADGICVTRLKASFGTCGFY